MAYLAVTADKQTDYYVAGVWKVRFSGL